MSCLFFVLKEDCTIFFGLCVAFKSIGLDGVRQKVCSF